MNSPKLQGGGTASNAVRSGTRAHSNIGRSMQNIGNFTICRNIRIIFLFQLQDEKTKELGVRFPQPSHTIQMMQAEIFGSSRQLQSDDHETYIVCEVDLKMSHMK